MKKFLVAVAVLAISMGSFAQTFGLKAGVNMANANGDDVTDTKARTSVLFGGFARFSLSDNFAFQPEVLYSGQGSTYKEDGLEETLKADYLNVPLMLKYYPSKGFNIQAGPQVGFLMSGKYKASLGDESGEVDIKDQMKSIDFTLNLGLGYDMESGLGFDLRYGLGLTNILDYDGADGKNSVFSFAVSYAF